MTKLRAAIVGTGGIAHVHAEALLHERERVELVAAADVNQQAAAAFAGKYGIPETYTDTHEMLARETPDLVHICTPPQLHAELTVACLEGGAWVLCEKPLVASLEQLDLIADAEARTGNFCSSVYQWRFGSGAQHLKKLIDAGALGRALLGLCQTTWFRDDAYYAVPWRGTWASELGGCTMGHGIHAIDLFLWLYGPWHNVTAKIGTLDHDIEVEDVSLALVEFENGALGSVVTSVVSPRQESYLRLDFQRATVELEHLHNFRNSDWTFTRPEGAPDDSEWQLPVEAPTLHHAQVSYMVACFRQGTRPLTSGQGARQTLEFIASLYKSALTGRTVARGSIGVGDPFYGAMNGRMAV